MGVVHAAYDPELDRKVALKLVRARAGASAAQLAREAHALARISHPNVVGVYDVGYCGQHVYVVMEFVAGVTLRAWLKQQARSLDQIQGVLRAAAEGLLAAHRAGVVHRDVKPENIMVDSEDRARVTDFGLARVVHGRRGADPTCERAGTIGYMSPEQLRGDLADARSDQFSFAVTAWEALTGLRPNAGSLRNGGPKRLASGSGDSSPDPSRSMRRDLARALARALDPEPDKRHETLAELVAALGSARPPLRRRIALGVGLALAAVAVGAVGVGLERHRATAAPICGGAEGHLAGVWDPQRSVQVGQAFDALAAPYAKDVGARVRPSLDEYGAAWVRAYTEACQATRVRRELSDAVLDERMACLDARLRQLDAIATEFLHPTEATAERAVSAVGSLADVATCLDSTGSRGYRRYFDPARTAKASELAQRIARVQAQTRVANYRAASADLDAVIASARELGDHRMLADIQLVAADVRRRTGDSTGQRLALESALSAAESSGDDELVAQAAVKLFTLAARLMNDMVLSSVYERLAQAAIERTGSPPKERARLLRAEISQAYDQGDYERGLGWGHEAVQLLEAAGLAQTSDAAESHLWLGGLYARTGRLDDAAREYRRALSIRERAVGPWHPGVAADLHDLADLEKEMGDFDKARADLARVRSIHEAAGTWSGEQFVTVEMSLGMIDFRSGDARAAVEHLRAAVGRAEEVLGDNTWTALAYADLGEALLRLPDLAQAHEAFEAGLAVLSRMKAPRPEFEALLRTGVGRVDLEAGRPRQALVVLEDAAARYATGQHEPLSRAEALLALARTLVALGREPERALSLAEQARESFAALPVSYAPELAESKRLVSRLQAQGADGGGTPGLESRR
jgi:tetratricopeptide (TPR) repeat protein